MMESGKFGRNSKSRVLVLLALACAMLSSCGTSHTVEQVVSEKADLPKSLTEVATDSGKAFKVSPAETTDGSIVLLRITVPEALAPKAGSVHGDFEGEALPFYTAVSKEDGLTFETVVAIPHSHKPGKVEATVSVGDTPAFRVPFEVTEAQYKTEALHVAAGKVNPKKQDMKRITHEQSEVGEVYARVTPTKYWEGPFSFPIASPMTSPYGTKRTYNGEPRNFHPGLDLKAAVGTPIHADAGGVVAMAKNLFFTGNTVLLDHGYGVITLFAHMSKLKVKKGQIVKAGELLGLSGKTGRVSGPHLHWQAVIHKIKINPAELTKVMR